LPENLRAGELREARQLVEQTKQLVEFNRFDAFREEPEPNCEEGRWSESRLN
jgi:hypothetical protein